MTYPILPLQPNISCALQLRGPDRALSSSPFLTSLLYRPYIQSLLCTYQWHNSGSARICKSNLSYLIFSHIWSLKVKCLLQAWPFWAGWDMQSNLKKSFTNYGTAQQIFSFSVRCHRLIDCSVLFVPIFSLNLLSSSDEGSIRPLFRGAGRGYSTYSNTLYRFF